ncbi:hypothetical protein NG799_27360 [Laspinema sp. D1]|uniref:Uncharacterized protein n=1 Tax=Laspinema palackyanum D2a TaxID=2953684 RepID=A0ABT2N1P2_9CYAN|nr:hypothetical protein [Laspinema sp. D2a]
MKAYNPNWNSNPPNLTPVDVPRQAPVSDRMILERFLAEYRKTGRCESLPQLVEIARLAHQKQLMSPKQARALFKDLDEIESALPPLLMSLSAQVTTFGDKIRNEEIPSPEERFELLDSFKETVECLDSLTAIARSHPDPPEPGVEEGVASCYVDTVKRINDLRYGLAYLSEHLRPQRLGHQLNSYPNPDLQIVSITDAIEDLYQTAMVLVPRLRENIARKVPQLWGSLGM